MGGFRTVVWTDTVQLSVMLLTVVCIFVTGVISNGGITEIWNKAEASERIEFFM